MSPTRTYSWLADAGGSVSVDSSSWPRVQLGEVLCHIARPLTVEVAGTDREIGIRSHGKGVFHKAPVTGAAIGDKRVFYDKVAMIATYAFQVR